MKFITATTPPRPLTFADVEPNQFFVAMQGTLWQRVTNTQANMVARESGELYSGMTQPWTPGEPILRLCEEVKRIEF